MEQERSSGTLTMPRVSIITPAYGASQYIAETLDSVFAQTFQNFEIIVINDGSPDTPQLEAALQPYRSRLQYIKQPNRGVSAARNSAVRQARGELLAFLDADDVWLPQYLETQVNFLNEHPDAVAAISDVLRFGTTARKPYERRMLAGGSRQLLTFEDMLQRKGGQLPSATVVRRSKALAAGLFDEELRVSEDIDFCMRICFPDGKIGYTKQLLVKYRWHETGISTTLPARGIQENELECLRRVARKLPLTAAQQDLLAREIAALEAELAMADSYENLTRREYDRAAAHLAEANQYYRKATIGLAIRALKIFPGFTSRILMAHKARRERAWKAARLDT